MSPSAVPIIAFSPDQRTVALAPSSSDKVWLYEVATGRLLHRLKVPDGNARSLAFTPDGKSLACGGGELVLWDVATGKLRRRFERAAFALDALAFSADGTLLASGGTDWKVHLWDVATGDLLRQIDSGSSSDMVTCLAFTADGATLAWGDYDGVIHLHDVRTGRQRGKCLGHEERIGCLAFSHDGTVLYSGSWDNTVRSWDVATRRQRHCFRGHEDQVDALAVTPDGKVLASGSADKNLRLWDTRSGKEIHCLRPHGDRVRTVSFAGDGNTLASGDGLGGVRVWRLRSGAAPVLLIGPRGAVACLAFSPDGQTVVTAEKDGCVRAWDVRMGRELRRFEAGRVPVTLTPDGRWLATRSGIEGETNLTVWDTMTGRSVGVPGEREGEGALAPDGKVVARAANDEYIQLCRVRDGKPIMAIQGPPGWVSGRDPMDAVSGGDGFGAIGGGITPGRPGPFDAGYFHSLAFSPDGRRLAGSWSAAQRVWDVATTRPLPGFGLSGQEATARRGGMNQFSADGRTLLLVTREAVQLWEVGTGRLRTQVGLDGHVGPPPVALSPDGRWLTIGARDGAIRLRDLATDREARTLHPDAGAVLCLAFSPDGTLLASGQEDATALLWDVPADRRPLEPPLSRRRLASLWDDLAREDAAVAYRAGLTLTRASRQAVALFRERWRSPDRSSQAHAVQRIGQLDADDYSGRVGAARELEHMGPAIAPALRATLRRRPSLEVRRRVEGILERLAPRLLPPEDVRAIRSVEVLERINSPEARTFLRELVARGPDTLLAEEASAALGRLSPRDDGPP